MKHSNNHPGNARTDASDVGHDALEGRLRAESPGEKPLPPFFATRLEAELHGLGRQRPQRAERGAWAWGGAGLGAAAAVLLAVALWPAANRGVQGLEKENGSPAAVSVAVDASPPAVTVEPSPSLPALGEVVRWSGELNAPLEQEQARLLADARQTLRFMAWNFVPRRYLPEVDAALAQAPAAEAERS